MTESTPRDGDTSQTWLRTLRNRLPAMILRPTTHPLGWGIVVAVAFIAAETLVVLQLRRIAPEVEFGTMLLLGVLVFLPLALLTSVVAGHARLRAADAERRRGDVEALANRHAALCRVATLVAGGADPVDVYPVAVTELGRELDVEYVTLVRFEPDDCCTVLAAHDRSERATLQAGEHVPLDSLPAWVGVPVTVDDRPRGVLTVDSSRNDPMPPEMEERIRDFADLVAAAIANSETHAQLRASRARILAAADEASRRFEGGLREGAQQRVAALGHGLRTVEASIPTEDQVVRQQLDNVINGLADLYTSLQELSRGIHPAASLSKGGLGPALRTLARRSPVPVSIDVDVDRRLPESTEVTAYYVVAEALTNTAKHSQAARVAIRVELRPDELLVEIADDGIGGATTASVMGGGSGLVGLRDRVETLAGRLEVSSPLGGGTTLTMRIPQAPGAPVEAPA